MNDPAMLRRVEAARAYEALFVPALLGQFAPIVAGVARVTEGDRVLDVACGTGILAREALRRVGPGGSVTGIDPALGMIEVAKEIAPTIEWHEGKAESLPFVDDSFDAVMSQFGFMFFTDRAQSIHEMLRVLKPNGRLAVAVWDSLLKMPAFASEVELLQRTAGQQAADALRAPFVLGDRDELSKIFTEVCTDPIEITTHQGTAAFPSIRIMVEADLRGWLPLMGVNLSEEQISQILNEAEAVLAGYSTTNGQVRFDVSAHVVNVKKGE